MKHRGPIPGEEGEPALCLVQEAWQKIRSSSESKNLKTPPCKRNRGLSCRIGLWGPSYYTYNKEPFKGSGFGYRVEGKFAGRELSGRRKRLENKGADLHPMDPDALPPHTLPESLFVLHPRTHTLARTIN